MRLLGEAKQVSTAARTDSAPLRVVTMRFLPFSSPPPPPLLSPSHHARVKRSRVHLADDAPFSRNSSLHAPVMRVPPIS